MCSSNSISWELARNANYLGSSPNLLKWTLGMGQAIWIPSPSDSSEADVWETLLNNWWDQRFIFSITRTWITHMTDLATIPIEVLVLSLYAFVSDFSLSLESPFQAWWFGGSVARWCPTLCNNPLDRSPLGSSVHGISQARTLEWAATSFSISKPTYFHLLKPYSLHFQAYLFSAAEILLKGQLGMQLPHKTFHQWKCVPLQFPIELSLYLFPINWHAELGLYGHRFCVCTTVYSVIRLPEIPWTTAHPTLHGIF